MSGSVGRFPHPNETRTRHRAKKGEVVVSRMLVTVKGQKKGGCAAPAALIRSRCSSLACCLPLTDLRRAPNARPCCLSGGRRVRPEIGRQWDGARAGVDHVDARAAVVV